MTEMIERVAKALFLKNNPRLSWEEESRQFPGSTGHFRLSAKIAIEAMREPTAAMRRAGAEAAAPPFASVYAEYEAMIDAALKDEQ